MSTLARNKQMALTVEELRNWITALRSGEYEQGYGKLIMYVTDTCKYKHCCIGVLADIKNVEFEVVHVDPENPTPFYSMALKNTAIYNFLPSSIIPRSLQVELSDLNDCKNYTFDMIADLLEERFALFLAD